MANFWTVQKMNASGTWLNIGQRTLSKRDVDNDLHGYLRHALKGEAFRVAFVSDHTPEPVA